MVRLILLLGLIYGAYAALAFLLQRRILFPGAHMKPIHELTVEDLPGVERFWIRATDAVTEAWYVPVPGATGAEPVPALLFAHGNAEFIDDWLGLLRPVTELGLALLLVEYPGYGRSRGRPTERSILESLTAAHIWLSEREEVDARRIVVMGRSLGGSAAALLARERPVAALILQSTFASVGSMAARAYFLPPFLVRDPFRTGAALASYRGPVLIIHGRHDVVVPPSHGERLASVAANAHVTFLDCGHNDCPPSWPQYWQHIRGFLEDAKILRPE